MKAFAITDLGCVTQTTLSSLAVASLMRRLWENYTSLKIEKKKENPPRAGEVVLITAEGCVVPKICLIINNDRLFQLI